MGAIKIKVFGADGIYRGGLFKDHLDRKLRWTGAPKPSLQEVMVCIESAHPGGGWWYLLELVLPRRIAGEEDRDSLFDERSRCCCRTPPQALHWFAHQSFGPPPALVHQVRSFVKEWDAFVASPQARGLAQQLIDRKFTDDDDPAVGGDNRRHIEMLRRLQALSVCHSGPTTSYALCSVASDAGLEAYIEWMNGHVAAIRHLVQAPAAPNSSTLNRRSDSSGPRREVSSKDRDVAALTEALKWDKEGRDWTLTALAIELGCHTNQLTGKLPSGRYRCPSFADYWNRRNAEKQNRADNLRATNRTRTSSESDDDDG